MRAIDADKLDQFLENAEIEAHHKRKYVLEGAINTLRGNIRTFPTIEPERKKMSNKEWVDFLSEQFTVSRTSAREMLHGLMKWKAEDNFKKQFSGGKNEKE